MGELKPLYEDTIPIDPLMEGQIRMDVKKMILVELLSFFSSGVGDARFYWRVKPFLGGDYYNVLPTDIGDDAYNEMEVLAWVAQ